uniref:60S ribosomal protein L14 n=1 Tax=Elaeophora elaphi TaxID=1147741 RepID=A0A0R3S6D3_9BILA
MNASFKVEFFIDETDKIAKLARNFRRTRAVEEIQPKWSKIRLGIKRFVRDQHRKAQKKKSKWASRKNASANHNTNEKST